MSGQDLNELLEDALNDLLIDDGKTTDKKQVEEKPVAGVQVEKEATKSRKKKNKKTSGEQKASCSNGNTRLDEAEMDRFFENMTAQLKAELPKMDPDEARARINESVPQIFDLMQNLLSKELLYPALKDLSPKFDDWLAKHKNSLKESDQKRYEEQRDIINEIIQVFDDESLNVQDRFEKNLELMEKMQSLGSPPEELTASSGSLGAQCSIM